MQYPKNVGVISFLKSTELWLFKMLILPVFPFIVATQIFFTPESNLTQTKPLLIFGLYALWIPMLFVVLRKTLFQALQILTPLIICVFLILVLGFGTWLISFTPRNCTAEEISAARVRYTCSGASDEIFFEADKGSVVMVPVNSP